MAIRKVKFAPGERYHICVRGVGKQAIFLDDRDYIRFLFLLLYFQAPISFFNLSRQVTHFVRSKAFNVSDAEKSEVLQKRQVSVESFALMPNHVHTSLQEIKERGVSSYMQRLLTGYAKYFNVKYAKTGHVFEGPFRAVPVESNEQLVYLSAYIHRNPRDLPEWRNKEHQYPWSSYQDYIVQNRWGEFLKPGITLDQFTDENSYKEFVESSGAKDKVVSQIGEQFLLDIDKNVRSKASNVVLWKQF